MTAQVWIAILVGVAAMIDDLRRRQIANWIPIVALAAGLVWQIAQSGWWGVLYGLGGAASGFAVFLIFYLLGGMGGGDVKLMAGFGALLGAKGLIDAAFWTALVGGLIAVGVLAARAIRRAVGGKDLVRSAATAEEIAAKESIPYAPAIALGVWLSLVPKV